MTFWLIITLSCTSANSEASGAPDNGSSPPVDSDTTAPRIEADTQSSDVQNERVAAEDSFNDALDATQTPAIEDASSPEDAIVEGPTGNDTTDTNTPKDIQPVDTVGDDASDATGVDSDISKAPDSGSDDTTSVSPPSTGNAIVIAAPGLPTALPAKGSKGALQSLSGPAPIGTITDVNITITLEHPCTKDLSATLVSPNGTTVSLFDLSPYPVCSSNMIDAHFDDEATVTVAKGYNPFTGSYQPDGLLSSFDGEDAAGIWTLEFYDDTIGDSGKLKSWALELTLN